MGDGRVFFTQAEREEIGFLKRFYMQTNAPLSLGDVVAYVELRRDGQRKLEEDTGNPLYGAHNRMVLDVATWIQQFAKFAICASELYNRYPHPFTSRMMPSIQEAGRNMRNSREFSEEALAE